MIKREATPTPLISIAAILLAALIAISMATGLLTIGFTIAARIDGTTVVDYYHDLFPTYRGTPHPVVLSRAAYFVFGAYTVVASLIAVFTRRRLARSWMRKRRPR